MDNNRQIIGREMEQRLIKEYYETEKAELIAVYGRRRVGKTFLIKQCFNNCFDFYFTGSFETSRATQLSIFKNELERYSGVKCTKPKDWFDAFEKLRGFLSTLKKDKIIVFLDELPWMDTPRSNFIQAFSYFWNTWASSVNGLKLFVCGSATTWMLSKLIGDKGGMHGRVNRQIYLRPFNLLETECFLKRKGVEWNRYQIVQTYMMMGGIPYYLDMIEKGMTLNENKLKLDDIADDRKMKLIATSVRLPSIPKEGHKITINEGATRTELQKIIDSLVHFRQRNLLPCSLMCQPQDKNPHRFKEGCFKPFILWCNR